MIVCESFFLIDKLSVDYDWSESKVFLWNFYSLVLLELPVSNERDYEELFLIGHFTAKDCLDS